MDPEKTANGAGESSPAPDGSRCISCGDPLPAGVEKACDRCLNVYVRLRAIEEMDAMIADRRKRNPANASVRGGAAAPYPARSVGLPNGGER